MNYFLEPNILIFHTDGPFAEVEGLTEDDLN